MRIVLSEMQKGHRTPPLGNSGLDATCPNNQFHGHYLSNSDDVTRLAFYTMFRECRGPMFVCLAHGGNVGAEDVGESNNLSGDEHRIGACRLVLSQALCLYICNSRSTIGDSAIMGD